MPAPKPEPAVVLLSGGMDSTVLLHYVVKRLQRAPVHGLSYDYGQRHARELEAARWQADQLELGAYRVIDISFVADLVKAGTTLVRGGAEVPDLRELSKERLDQPPTYVPNRNMMLLSIAAGYAEAQGVADVFYGAQAHDEYGYWDCTREFLERINGVLALNRRTPVRIHAPFIDKRKRDLVPLGEELGIDFAHTWSCYRGGAAACGTCPTCAERRKAFDEAGVADPLPYAASEA